MLDCAGSSIQQCRLLDPAVLDPARILLVPEVGPGCPCAGTSTNFWIQHMITPVTFPRYFVLDPEVLDPEVLAPEVLDPAHFGRTFVAVTGLY